MNIYKFRVILDTNEDVFRDIEIGTESTFEEFHEAILHAFDFKGEEMASFYMSDEDWEKGQEITLLEMGADMGIKMDDQESIAFVMKEVKLKDLVKLPSEKILYVFDFMRMWCFYIELMSHKKAAPSTLYPRVGLVYGDAPAQDSKEADLFDFEPAGGKGKKEKYKTGDPEIDAYLDDDDDDDDDYEDSGFENLDDLDDSYY